MIPAITTMCDVVFVDPAEPGFVSCRRASSIACSIPGRYILTRWIDAKGKPREFSCRVVRISSDAMTLAAPVSGAIDERVSATLLEFGKVEGRVLKTHQLGFMMSIVMKDQERERFASKIEWYDKHKNHGLPDNRRFRRIVPRNPHSTVVLSDGTVAGAFIIDVSISGVAVSAEIEPQIGEALAVGKIVGRVVRHFAGGFGVKFIHDQDPQTLERCLREPKSEIAKL